MGKLLIVWAAALCLAGAANAQIRPGDPIGGQAPAYAVEGLALGSKVKRDSAMYREYKCSPSEQFDGFTWCQKTRRESERRGSFEATYSILHSKDGTVVYANRHQQPKFLDAGEADRDIENYTRKLGQPPRITKIPRRSGTSDAIMAVWGKVELEPLDPDSVKMLAEGKSPKKGLLIDFVSNFGRSAQEGLPIYRIIGGAGFVWVASFDQRGRGTLRFAAVDASPLQPGLVATQPPTAPQNDEQRPAQSDDQQPAQSDDRRGARGDDRQPAQSDDRRGAPGDDRQPAQSDDRQAARSDELAAATKARRDAELAVARLQSELSTALKAKTDAELAWTESEKAAQKAKTDVEIARKEFEEARDDANAAREEIERLKAGGDRPAPYGKGIIVLIGLSVTAILFLLILVFSRMLTASPKETADMGADMETGIEAEVGKADTDLEARGDDVQGAVVPLSTASDSAETKPGIDQDELVDQLARTLGVQAPVVPLAAETPADADCDPPAALQREDTQASTSGAEGVIPSKEPAEDSVLLFPRRDGREEGAKSSVLGIPDAGEAKEVKPA
jgi:hypothetical protein